MSPQTVLQEKINKLHGVLNFEETYIRNYYSLIITNYLVNESLLLEK